MTANVNDGSEPLYRQQLQSAGVSVGVLDQTDEQFRALGRVHYQFAAIIRTAEISIHVRAAAAGQGTVEGEVQDTLRTKTAAQGMRMWFALSRSTYPHSESELQVHEWFRVNFEEFNRLRNVLAHGTLHFGYGTPGAGTVDLSAIKVSSNGRVSRDERLQSTGGLDELADDIWYFRRRLSEYASLVHSIFMIDRSPGRVDANLESETVEWRDGTRFPRARVFRWWVVGSKAHQEPTTSRVFPVLRFGLRFPTKRRLVWSEAVHLRSGLFSFQKNP